MLITCPNTLPLDSPEFWWPRVFLAGGIKGCDDWQSDLASKLEGEKVVLFNPRRYSETQGRFSDEMHRDQVSWEYSHLRLADIQSFWFAPETLNPITLFEFGVWLTRNGIGTGRVLVGIDPNYAKRRTVLEQIRLDGSILTPVASSLSELAFHIKKAIQVQNGPLGRICWGSPPSTPCGYEDGCICGQGCDSP